MHTLWPNILPMEMHIHMPQKDCARVAKTTMARNYMGHVPLSAMREQNNVNAGYWIITGVYVRWIYFGNTGRLPIGSAEEKQVAEYPMDMTFLKENLHPYAKHH